MALDHTVARSIPEPKKEKRRDKWDRAFDRRNGEAIPGSWRDYENRLVLLVDYRA